MVPELLSPAGSRKAMRYAFAYGADAVYAGQPRYSLRVRNNEFNHLENIAEAIESAHSQNKQFYIASNLSPHNDKIRSYIRDMEPVIAMKPDALIMSDPGLIMMVRERWPEVPVHLSVQANVVNHASVKFWQSVGISRVILSRELSLDEIEEIRQQCPDIELEVFVHGALCIAYSGRCLLSGYMTHRDSNQGACTNSCRWKYQAHEAKETETGDIIPVKNEVVSLAEEEAVISAQREPEDIPEPEMFLLQEQGRPGEYMPAYEDEHGTYIMNSKDLRAVQHVQRLAEMGIESLKIEGRTKSHFYVARTAQVYRQAIEDFARGKGFNKELMGNLESLASRGYTEGFYRRHVPKEYQNYETGHSVSSQQQFVGEVLESDSAEQTIWVDVKNKFSVGEKLELMTPKGNLEFELEGMENKNGAAMETAPGSGHRVKIRLPVSLDGDMGLIMKRLDKPLHT